MLKAWLPLIISTMMLSSPALAAPNRTPNGDGIVSCSCGCNAGKGNYTKTFTWSGTRSGCQGYSGGGCAVIEGGKVKKGELSSCDVIVYIKKPGKPIGGKVKGVFKAN